MPHINKIQLGFICVLCFSVGTLFPKSGCLEWSNKVEEQQSTITIMKAEKRAILHVGPTKTGCTFLQVLIEKERQSLAMDNVVVPQANDAPGPFIGRKATANAAIALRSPNRTLTRFLEFMKRSADQGKNVLMSAEDFSHPNTSLSALAWMLAPWDHVTVVVVYRRFFEWLRSDYFETYRLEHIPPDQWSGPPIPSFVEVLRTRSFLKHPQQASRVLERYQKYFPNVVVINYHDESRSLQEKFFCAFLPQLQHMCARQKENHNPPRSNVRTTLEYLRLVQSAIQHNVLRRNCDIKKAVKQVGKRMRKRNQEWYHLPLECVEDSIAQQLYDITVEDELRILSVANTTSIRASFDKFRTTSLCAVRVEQLLNDSEWRTFLSYLG